MLICLYLSPSKKGNISQERIFLLCASKGIKQVCNKHLASEQGKCAKFTKKKVQSALRGKQGKCAKFQRHWEVGSWKVGQQAASWAECYLHQFTAAIHSRSRASPSDRQVQGKARSWTERGLASSLAHRNVATVEVMYIFAVGNSSHWPRGANEHLKSGWWDWGIEFWYYWISVHKETFTCTWWLWC